MKTTVVKHEFGIGEFVYYRLTDQLVSIIGIGVAKDRNRNYIKYLIRYNTGDEAFVADFELSRKQMNTGSNYL